MAWDAIAAEEEWANLVVCVTCGSAMATNNVEAWIEHMTDGSHVFHTTFGSTFKWIANLENRS